MKRPAFSIVIPTCDRAHLLAAALESVLEDQGHEDYEVVVSDNFSSDDTQGTIAGFACARLRAVRTARRLSMADHWEFALGQARGDYVAYLCDDDAWTPGVLASVASALDRDDARLVGMFRARYFAPNCDWEGWANSLAVTPYSGGVVERDSRESLRALFERQETLRMPKMFNSFTRRDLLERAASTWGRLFRPWCPDYSFPAILLNETPRWTLIDRPLWLRYYGSESIGTGARDRLGDPFQRFLEEHGSDVLPKRTPLRLPIASNYAVDTLLEVKALAPERFEGIDVGWERYFVTCWRELANRELGGEDVSVSRRHFDETLASRGPEFERSVRSAIDALVYDASSHGFIARPALWPLRRALSGYELPAALWRAVSSVAHRARGQHPPVFLRGEDAGFSGILDCARKLPALLGRSPGAAQLDAGLRVSHG